MCVHVTSILRTVRVLLLLLLLLSFSKPLLSSLFDFSHFNRCIMLSHCIFNCIFLMANDVKHFFMCLFAIRIPSLVKYFLKSFVCFFFNWVVTIEFESSFLILNIGLFWNQWFADISPRLQLIFSFPEQCPLKNKSF